MVEGSDHSCAVTAITVTRAAAEEEEEVPTVRADGLLTFFTSKSLSTPPSASTPSVPSTSPTLVLAPPRMLPAPFTFYFPRPSPPPIKLIRNRAHTTLHMYRFILEHGEHHALPVNRLNSFYTRHADAGEVVRRVGAKAFVLEQPHLFEWCPGGDGAHSASNHGIASIKAIPLNGNPDTTFTVMMNV